MSELHDRLERLAGRGTRRGADDVIRAAEQTGVHDADPTGPTTDERDLEIIDGLPLVTAEPLRRRNRFGTLIAATGIAALIGVGALAVTAMFGSGGAASPEAAVKQLADAVSHRDPLAAVDVLAPSEVRSMHENVQHITQRAADLKLVDDASKPLAGVDLSVDNLQLSSNDVADGFAKVTITGGTISADAHRAALSQLLQDAMRNSDDPNPQSKVELARLAASQDLPTFVMTVRHDGRWYVSPAYTALEYAREINDGPPADFGSADAAQLGADTPQHAVEDAMHAWQAADWNRLLALAPPDELPVYDYRAWIDQQAADTHPDFTIDALSTTADVSGDHGVVQLTGSGTMGSGSDRGTWQVGGTCPSAGDWVDTIANDGVVPSSNVSERVCLAGDVGRALLPLGLFLSEPVSENATSGPLAIEVVREDGRWFVSPVGTVLDIIGSFVQHADEHTLYPFIGLGYKLPPDATLTLNQPTTITTPNSYNHVLAFDGTAGQKVIGQIDSMPGRGNFYLSGELYTADGKDVGYVDFAPKAAGYAGETMTLPETGSYRLVIVEALPSGTTLTLYDSDHAPKALLNPPNLGSAGGSCTYTGNSVSCFGTAVPIPVQVGGSSSSSSSEATTTTVP